MPGVFIVEAFGQAAAALTAYCVDPKEYENKLVYLMSVEKARFRNPVLPDCELHLDIENMFKQFATSGLKEIKMLITSRIKKFFGKTIVSRDTPFDNLTWINSVKSHEQIKNIHRNEQEYLSAALMKKNALVYWPDHWCRSFKRHCIKPFSFFIARETLIPADMRVLVFHGKPDPHEAIAGVSGKWYRRFKPAKWISQHWH